MALLRKEPSLPPFASRWQRYHRAQFLDRSLIPAGIFLEALASWCPRLDGVWTLGFSCGFSNWDSLVVSLAQAFPVVSLAQAFTPGNEGTRFLKHPFRGTGSDSRASAVSARIEPNPVVNDWARERNRLARTTSRALNSFFPSKSQQAARMAEIVGAAQRILQDVRFGDLRPAGSRRADMYRPLPPTFLSVGAFPPPLPDCAAATVLFLRHLPSHAGLTLP
jgi:hypothetical protein